jgi:hypothetical protein
MNKDISGYSKIIAIGDIHGCAGPLIQYFKEHPFKLKNFYIFVGDYFNRGMQCLSVFNLLWKLYSLPNVLLILGNHELLLYREVEKYMTKGIIPVFDDITKCSFEQIIGFPKQPNYKNKVSRLYKVLSVMRTNIRLLYHNFIFDVSHYGTPIPGIFMNLTKKCKYNNIDDKFNHICKYNEYQIHGHKKNITKCVIYDHCINVDNSYDIEFHGNFSIAQIVIKNKKVKTKVFTYKNTAPPLLLWYNPKILPKIMYTDEKIIELFNYSRYKLFKYEKKYIILDTFLDNLIIYDLIKKSCNLHSLF